MLKQIVSDLSVASEQIEKLDRAISYLGELIEYELNSEDEPDLRRVETYAWMMTSLVSSSSFVGDLMDSARLFLEKHEARLGKSSGKE